MSELKTYLKYCKQEYYLGNPIISDSQYDALEEICSEDLSVGTNKGRIKHWYKMYSLRKYYTDEPYPDYSAIITPKLDGASLSLQYIEGHCTSIVTRGDGEYGENITHLFNVENCEKLGIPVNFSMKGVCQITGEVVAPKSIPNARNYAAGALNLENIIEFSERDIKFFAYDMQESPELTYVKTLWLLKNIGFEVVNNKLKDKYPVDGEVYRLDSNKIFKELGFTSKHPRGAFAVKERSEGIKTTILDVIWQTGKSGKVTPVALLEPINIDGATVSRATLNNLGFIEALGIQIGDNVMVERAGGIIPRIIRKI